MPILCGFPDTKADNGQQFDNSNYDDFTLLDAESGRAFHILTDIRTDYLKIRHYPLIIQ